MTTRELIHAAIANVPDEKLDDLYRVVRRISARQAGENVEEGIMAKLLAASDAAGVVLLRPDRDCEPGSGVK